MYPEFEKVNAFIAEASLLNNTKRRMEDIFELTMSRNHKAIAVEYLNVKDKLTHYKYAQLRNNVYKVATTLKSKIGEKKIHSVVALKMANSPLWIESFWAILMAGYKPLLLDARTSKEGTSNLIKQSKAVAIVSDDLYEYDVIKVYKDELLSNGCNIEPTWEDEVIFCSSGTTGDVKLMVYNGNNISHQICCSLDVSKETKDIVYPKQMGKLKILAMVPFHHIFGFVAVFLWYTYYGKTLVFPHSITPTDIQFVCKKAHVTHVYSVPLFWDSLAKQLTRRLDVADKKKKELVEKMIKYNLGEISKEGAGLSASKIARKKVQNILLGNKIRYCISGGGYLSMDTLKIINGIGYNLYNGYGMTEIGVTSVNLSSNVKDRLDGTIGHAFFGIDYRIDKPHANGEGELLVKSGITHIREIIGGVEKKTVLTSDGYFKTGDIALIKDGKVEIKGRIKDVIINADGENIYPDELEIFFKGLPHVNHLSILGTKKKGSKDENVVLVLETDNEANEKVLSEIQKQVKEIEHKLPHGTKISEIYLARNKLPLANNMKVKRFIVKSAIEEESKDFISINKKKETKKFADFDEKTIAEILVPMRAIFSNVLILPEYKIEDDAHWINDLGGDSMNYVELITETQAKFGIEFPEETLGQMACVNDFVYEVAKLKKDTNK